MRHHQKRLYKRAGGCVFLTVALHRVGLVLRGSLHHLLHHVSLPMGCSQGHHEEEDACYS